LKNFKIALGRGIILKFCGRETAKILVMISDPCLEEKVEVIRFFQNGNSNREASGEFNVSKGSIMKY